VNRSISILSVLLLTLQPAAAGEVLPIKPLPARSREHLGNVPGRIYDAAQKQARYLRGTIRPWQRDGSMRLLTASASGEHTIRPNTSAIEGFAFLYRFGPYDENLVGVSRDALLKDTIIPMLRYCVATHVTGPLKTDDGKHWGDAWQSAYWAQMLGRAAWWIWDDLPDDLRQGVRRVVAHEADRFTKIAPPHQIPADTKAEENAWNSLAFHAAVLIMPDDPRRAEWDRQFQRWALSSFLRPADAKSKQLIDGRTVAEQFTGANIHDEFTLENHGFVHPDYMTCFGITLGAEAEFRLSGRRPPEALQYNAREIYENLKWFALPDGGFVYPSGQDWELFRNAGWVNPHVQMAAFARDPDAWRLAGRCLDTLEKMQARSQSGAVCLPEEYFFASTQHALLRGLCAAWLNLQLVDDVPEGFRERRGVRHLEAGKIILHRTPAAVHSVSWGAKIMAQCVPFRADRIVSPDQRNGVGHIRIPGRRDPLPLKLRDAKIDSTDDRFTAELLVDHGTQVRAKLLFVSRADGSMTIGEELTALTEVTTSQVATGLIGVLNNRRWVYERGKREVRFDDRTLTVPVLSGKPLPVAAAQRVAIDGVFLIEGRKPLALHYAGAAAPDRGRATDRLYLNYQDAERTWKPGQTIAAWEATLRVGD
jgi:hypothetical protein